MLRLLVEEISRLPGVYHHLPPGNVLQVMGIRHQGASNPRYGSRISSEEDEVPRQDYGGSSLATNRANSKNPRDVLVVNFDVDLVESRGRRTMGSGIVHQSLGIISDTVRSDEGSVFHQETIMNRAELQPPGIKKIGPKGTVMVDASARILGDGLVDSPGIGHKEM